jgi:hypothetical protein
MYSSNRGSILFDFRRLASSGPGTVSPSMQSPRPFWRNIFMARCNGSALISPARRSRSQTGGAWSQGLPGSFAAAKVWYPTCAVTRLPHSRRHLATRLEKDLSYDARRAAAHLWHHRPTRFDFVRGNREPARAHPADPRADQGSGGGRRARSAAPARMGDGGPGPQRQLVGGGSGVRCDRGQEIRG